MPYAATAWVSQKLRAVAATPPISRTDSTCYWSPVNVSVWQLVWAARILPRLRVELSPNRPLKEARKSLTFSTSGRRREFATCVSYSDWELNPDFGRLNLEPLRGMLHDSLSSDGLQKSDENREREAEKAV